MPDTSKDTPEEYAARCLRLAQRKPVPLEAMEGQELLTGKSRQKHPCCGMLGGHATWCNGRAPQKTGLFKCPACGNWQTGDGVCTRCAFVPKGNWEPMTRQEYRETAMRGIKATIEKTKSQGESVSEPVSFPLLISTGKIYQLDKEQFTPGQTVYYVKDMSPLDCISAKRCVVLAESDGFYWCRTEGGGGYFTVSADEISATAPNQPAEPILQKCPFCQCYSRVRPYGTSQFLVECSVTPPCLVGPHLYDKVAAIQAWNSIRVVTSIDMQKEHVVKSAIKDFESAFSPVPIKE